VANPFTLILSRVTEVAKVLLVDAASTPLWLASPAERDAISELSASKPEICSALISFAVTTPGNLH